MVADKNSEIVCLIAALVGFVVSGCSQQKSASIASEDKVLNLYTWREYLNPEVISQFTASTGIRVSVETYDLSDEMLEKLRHDPAAYDVVITDDLSVQRLRAKRLLRSLDDGKLSNRRHLLACFKESAREGSEGFAVPYLWGTTVLAYRKDRIENPSRTWKVLFDDTNQDHRAVFLSEPLDCLENILRGLGKDPHTLVAAEIDAAANEVLKAVRDRDARLLSDIDARRCLERGYSDYAMLYSGDAALLAQNAPEKIDFFIPEEGATLWFDSFTITRDSPSTALAHQFINYMLEPQNAAASSNYLRYASTNAAAEEFIDQDLLQDDRIYPSKAILSKCHLLMEAGRKPAVDHAWGTVADALFVRLEAKLSE
ncbi:MAG: spermidine/putrescine transport system substrate-binding protein [Verrucomicrobiales bacterium]|jgi:spermidine/putrescine transport system substrate-binding protein